MRSYWVKPEEDTIEEQMRDLGFNPSGYRTRVGANWRAPTHTELIDAYTPVVARLTPGFPLITNFEWLKQKFLGSGPNLPAPPQQQKVMHTDMVRLSTIYLRSAFNVPIANYVSPDPPDDDPVFLAEPWLFDFTLTRVYVDEHNVGKFGKIKSMVEGRVKNLREKYPNKPIIHWICPFLNDNDPWISLPDADIGNLTNCHLDVMLKGDHVLIWGSAANQTHIDTMERTARMLT